MFTIRPLSLDDIHLIHDITDILNTLSPSPQLTIQQAHDCLSRMFSQQITIFAGFVEDKVVGLVTVLLEQKLLRGGARAGHIEDMVVHPAYQGQGIGTKLLLYAVAYAQSQGVYKCILDCDESLVGWYESCGFSRAGVFMKKSFL